MVDDTCAIATGGYQYPGGINVAAAGGDAGDFTTLRVNGRGFCLLVDVDTFFCTTFGQSPYNRVMADNAAGRMIHGALYWKSNVF